ncbi:hypothetical protein AAZX31_05G063100 [Glycine max]|uniref:Expansin-like B1 n=1 Tax=Glycine soja TaxID=3848 RepID=A0A0B2R479_GLYSO|nr:expansin-like B1 [Glycine max]XP_028230968.1 expansin-like B1 [Glycine soja]KAG5028367.1 hypothetical protein JHK87_011881 [Glycine soja]KAH1249163.1 Expansin-like B1 [Glycine max]KHN28470.1 Expansin-like B1 [Glycine soja]RZC11279.1 Expansin-like B1 [Glycine soja]|eukprot:XP_003525584.1 expansin-like B1 [Glycine max]
MELSFKHQLGLVCVILFFPALCNCQEYIGPVDDYWNPIGACGFGEYGKTVNNGIVAAVSEPLWRDGAGCGTCYQVCCKLQCCDEKGVYVVVSDAQGDRRNSSLTLSPGALSILVHNKPGCANRIKHDMGDIVIKRVPCRYPGNIKLRVQESSKNPGYFAVVILDVNGIRDITAVEMWLKSQQRWEPLRRSYGAVFDFANPPSGEILLRFKAGFWKQAKIPANWKPGATYDTKVQIPGTYYK